MTLGRMVNKPLQKLKIQIKRYPGNDLGRRIKLLNHHGINKIFDIGANIGGYSITTREAGYKGKIVSFEPLSREFAILSKAAKNDKNWKVVNCAIGNQDAESFINIAGNSESSSLLEMLPVHSINSPKSSYIGKEKITVKKIDTIFPNYLESEDRILLKIDTQGFEKEVLAGAEKSLSKIMGIHIEMSLTMLYDGEILYSEMISFLKNKGFNLYSLENGFSNPATGELLQIDGIFFRPD